MSRISQFIFLVLALCSTIGCRKPEPQPELRDPIYHDLLAQAAKHKGLAAAEEKTAEDMEKQVATAEPELGMAKRMSPFLLKSRQKRIYHEQMSEYFRLRAQSRIREARKNYYIAFVKEQVWPDPKEFQSYQDEKRLREASLNWSKRVPSNSHRYSAKAEAPKAEKKEAPAGDGGGGGHH